MSKSTNWGIHKATYNGHGLYWHGATNTYNVEGYGYFKTIADARTCADAINAQRKQKELADAQAKIANGAIRCERVGDIVRVHFPEGLREMPLREYRQNVFSWEDKYGKEFVWA